MSEVIDHGRAVGPWTTCRGGLTVRQRIERVRDGRDAHLEHQHPLVPFLERTRADDPRRAELVLESWGERRGNGVLTWVAVHRGGETLAVFQNSFYGELLVDVPGPEHEDFGLVWGWFRSAEDLYDRERELLDHPEDLARVVDGRFPTLGEGS